MKNTSEDHKSMNTNYSGSSLDQREKMSSNTISSTSTSNYSKSNESYANKKYNEMSSKDSFITRSSSSAGSRSEKTSVSSYSSVTIEDIQSHRDSSFNLLTDDPEEDQVVIRKNKRNNLSDLSPEPSTSGLSDSSTLSEKDEILVPVSPESSKMNKENTSSDIYFKKN